MPKVAPAAPPPWGLSLPVWLRIVRLVALRRLRPMVARKLELPQLSPEHSLCLRWVPEHQVWWISLRAGRAIYEDTRPRLRNFAAGIDDLLRSHEAATVPPPGS